MTEWVTGGNALNKRQREMMDRETLQIRRDERRKEREY